MREFVNPNVSRSDLDRCLRRHGVGNLTGRFITADERTPAGQHAFDALCAALGIEHRLTPPRRPQTNGMAERFRGRIEEVLRSHHFVSGQNLEQTLCCCVALYNHHLPQAALKGQTPLQAMKDWYRRRPELLHKRPYDRAGYDIYPFMVWGWTAMQGAGWIPATLSPPPVLDSDALWVILTGMLGIAGMRSWEKSKGVAR